MSTRHSDLQEIHKNPNYYGDHAMTILMFRENSINVKSSYKETHNGQLVSVHNIQDIWPLIHLSDYTYH
jgi:hypothetical protein